MVSYANTILSIYGIQHFLSNMSKELKIETHTYMITIVRTLTIQDENYRAGFEKEYNYLKWTGPNTGFVLKGSVKMFCKF